MAGMNYFDSNGMNYFDWLMAFHPDKCTVLTITQKKTPFKHDYILHNHILEPVTSAKYLGVSQSNLK